MLARLALNLATAAAAAVVRSGAPRRMGPAARMADAGLGSPEIAILGGGFGGL